MGIVLLQMSVSAKEASAGRIVPNLVLLVDGAHHVLIDALATMVLPATLSLVNAPAHQVGKASVVTPSALTRGTVKTVERYASVKMEACVTINQGLVAVLLVGVELCVTILVRPGLMEPIAPVLVCAKTRVTAIQSLEIATVPWDGRALSVQTPVRQGPITSTAKRSVTAIMELCVTMSMENVIACRATKEQSAKNNVHMDATGTTASSFADVKMAELVIQLMVDVPALQVGKVRSVINVHVLVLNSMASLLTNLPMPPQ